VFVVVVLVMGFASAATVGGVAAVTWTETADFCGRCHTMDPELKAHALSPHREVACAECHVEPGLDGWVKAKLNGTRQLIMVLTGTFQTPIPPPDHGDLPPTDATCVRCHDPEPLVADGGPVTLVLEERFDTDEANSRDTVALVLRPSGFGGTTATRGVHWHIAEEVQYLTPDPRAQTIDYVANSEADGSTTEYLASSVVTNSANVQPDIDRLMAEQQPLRTMDCIDCHNRVGHGVPTPDQAVDDSLSSQRIDQNLPFIKREATARRRPTTPRRGADRAIEGAPIVLPDPLSAGGGLAGTAGERGHRRPEAHLPSRGDTRDARLRYDVSEQPGPSVRPGLLPLPRRRPLQGRQRCPDGRVDPLGVRHLPHLPPDRLDRLGRADRRATRHPR
jgi:nitrate/TMAO reductase-like tetraheme cytochrome c subunit